MSLKVQLKLKLKLRLEACKPGAIRARTFKLQAQIYVGVGSAGVCNVKSKWT